MKQQKPRTGAPKQEANSISFGPLSYDQQKHLLQTQAKTGGNTIRCSITEDVFTELFHCSPAGKELNQSFEQHKTEISRALLSKIQNKQWKIPNQEILLNAQDMRQYSRGK